MAFFFATPFALTGDKTSIPLPAQLSGAMSYTQGFTPDYELDPETEVGAKRIPRDQTNELYYNITLALREWQTQAFPEFITSADNGGSPYPYTANAVVRYGGVPYISLVGTNVALPTDATKWAVFDLTGGLFVTKANNLSDLANIATARTNLGLGSAAVQSASYFLQAAAAAITGGGLGLVGVTKSDVTTTGGSAIDTAANEYQTRALSANTTYTFTNAVAGKAHGFVLELTVSSGAVATWPASVKWANNTTPTLANGIHLIGFVTLNGGTTWRGVVLGRNYPA